MVITNKIAFIITVILGVLLALFLFGKLLTLIAESEADACEKRKINHAVESKPRHKPENTKGKGDGLGQFVIFVLTFILLLMTILS